MFTHVPLEVVKLASIDLDVFQEYLNQKNEFPKKVWIFLFVFGQKVVKESKKLTCHER
jgi:hypothetical protein